MLRRIVLVGAGALALASVVLVPGIAAAKPVTGNVACTLSGTAVISPGLPLATTATATKTYKSNVVFTGTLSGCTGTQQNIKTGFGPIDHGTTSAKGSTKYAKGTTLPNCIALQSPAVPTVLKATTIFMDSKSNVVGKSVGALTVGGATLGPPVSFPSTGPITGGSAFKGATATTVANLSNAGGAASACQGGSSTTFEFTDGTSTLDIH